MVKNAIVTGASKGIGLAISKALLENGIRVFGWSRTPPSLKHPNFHYFPTDISDWQEVEKSFALSQLIFKNQIHYLINNAGIGIFSNIENTTIEDWKKMFYVNVNGAFYCTKLVVPIMKKNDFGHIINISSVAGLTPLKNGVGYSATKHAISGFSHSLMEELRDFGIKVTCLYPSSTQTHFSPESNSKKNKLRPEDIAQSVVHLLLTSSNYLPVDLQIRPLRPNKLD